MTISLDVNDKNFDQFTEASVSVSMLQASGSFSISATSSVPKNFPAKAGDLVSVRVDGKKVLTGYVDGIQVSYNSQHHTITIQGRSKTADLIDSKMPIALSFTENVTLVAVIQKILSTLGIKGISVTAELEIDPFKTGELVAGKVGQGAFGFAEQFARKRQVLITDDGEGNIILIRNSGIDSGNQLLNIVGGEENNIKKGNLEIDESQVFNRYVVKSQLNSVAISELFSSIDPKTAVDQKAEVTDSSVREGRVLTIVAENATSTEESAPRAKWEADVRRSKARTYECEVVGHSDSKGALWALNRLVSVEDDFANIKFNMLIDRLKFDFSVTTGNTTLIHCVPPDAYKVLAEEPESTKKTGAFTPEFLKGL